MNQGSYNAELHDFYDGQSIVESRSGSIASNGDLYRKNTWGLIYIDELVHMGVAPSSSAVYYYFDYWVMQNANYNVVGVVNEHGRLSERYEYTPFGQRITFSGVPLGSITQYPLVHQRN